MLLSLQDKYVLGVMVFLCCIAVENAVAAAIKNVYAQSLFDQICLYILVGVFTIIHIASIIIVIIKVRVQLFINSNN